MVVIHFFAKNEQGEKALREYYGEKLTLKHKIAMKAAGVTEERKILSEKPFSFELAIRIKNKTSSGRLDEKWKRDNGITIERKMSALGADKDSYEYEVYN